MADRTSGYLEVLDSKPGPAPLSRPPQPDQMPLDELLDAILELTAAVRELKDYLAMDQWRRSNPVSPPGGLPSQMLAS